MKKHLQCFLSASLSLLFLTATPQANKHQQTNGFIENKGQVSDQNGFARPDVLFSGNAGPLVCHFRAAGVSYQLSQVQRWKKEVDVTKKSINPIEKMIPEETAVHRLDVEWLNINSKTTIQTDAALPGFSNYYLAVCPHGIHNVNTYSGLTYKNIYNGIDLHYYHKGANMKYDYLVAPFADYTKIGIRVKGTDGITLQADGSVIFKTPLGNIREEAPLVYQNNKQVAASWILKGEDLSFSIQDYNPALPLIIDPMVRAWGTYYGGSDEDEGRSCATDANGFVFMTGRTKSSTNMATTGVYQVSIAGTDYDMFLVKFNDQGVRQWATYYGGTGEEYGNACVADAFGNSYVAGRTSVSSGVASPGTGHQGFNGGGVDAMLVKFNSAGARVWGTYYGGSGLDQGLGLAIDGSSLYMSGYTMSAPGGFPANPIATAGGHQTIMGNGFLVKFNTSGVRQWGTYYGGPTYAPGTCVSTDGNGNVYMGGLTMETTGIATPGAHQTTFNGLYDGYLVKFNAAGVRQWGTYYGDVSLENFAACVADASGNVYAAGITGSPTGIATAGAHQTVIGLAYNGDGMLVKFNSAGVRLWGTYYGGNTDDAIGACALAPSGDIYIAGLSNSPAGISTSDAIQPNLISADAFIARFTAAGVRLWGTYYGGSGTEIAYGCDVDANGKVYMAGFCASATIIATPGSHQTVYGGGTSDGFLVQFFECTAPPNPVNTTAATNLTVCSGSSATLSASGTGTITWYNSAPTPASLGNGSSMVTPTLSAGTVTFFAQATNSCAALSGLIPVTITVVAGPPVSIAGSSPGVCPGKTLTLTASGASQYTWNTMANVGVITVTPSVTTVYTVSGFANGCASPASYTATVYTAPSLTIAASSNPVCIGETATLTVSGAAQYTWNAGPTSPVMVITSQGPATYSVTGNSVQGCVGIAGISIQMSPCTGLTEINNLFIDIFPNPFNETITVQSAEALKIRVMNTVGQVLIQERINAGTTTIDLTMYPAAVYILEVTEGEHTKMIKVIKE